MDIYSKEFLNRINPKRDQSSKYSQYLYLWLRYNKRYRKVFFAENFWFDPEKSDEFSEDKNVSHQIYIGIPDEVPNDEFFSGSELRRIINFGSKEHGYAYHLKKLGNVTDITDWFWEKYLRIGKCAIDPEHTIYWRERYDDIDDKSRSCRWCGRVENLHIVERTVKDKVWKPVV
jgi:hypothetical protein